MLDMLESQVITRIKTQFSKKLKDRYPNLKFTNSDRADTVPKFQIEVTTNTKMDEAKEVMDEVVRIMKTMRFQVTSMPEFQNTDSVYRRVARFRRIIGADDVL